MRILRFFPVIFLASVLLAIPALAQTIPANTPIMVRLNQGITSRNAKRNERVKAIVERDVAVDGAVLVPKGSPAAVFVEKVRPGGMMSKKAVLLLRFDAVTLGGRAYPVSAKFAGQPPEPMKREAKNAGVIGAPGTPIPSKATGRRTAASGGAAAGNINPDAISPEDKADVFYPADTVLDFRLKAPVHVKGNGQRKWFVSRAR